MKLAVKFILIIFMLFLATPTIVSLIEKKVDTACFFSMAEEEMSHKEVKVEVKLTNTTTHFYISEIVSKNIHSENLSKHDNVFTSIFVPPPDLV